MKEQFRRRVTLPNGNRMAYERDGQHYIGDKVGSKLRRLPVSSALAHLIAAQPDNVFSIDVKHRLNEAELCGNPKLHISKAAL